MLIGASVSKAQRPRLMQLAARPVHGDSPPLNGDTAVSVGPKHASTASLFTSVPFCLQLGACFGMSYPPPINRQQLGIPQLPPRIPPPQFAGFAPPVPPGNNEKDDEDRCICVGTDAASRPSIQTMQGRSTDIQRSWRGESPPTPQP